MENFCVSKGRELQEKSQLKGERVTPEWVVPRKKLRWVLPQNLKGYLKGLEEILEEESNLQRNYGYDSAYDSVNLNQL